MKNIIKVDIFSEWDKLIIKGWYIFSELNEETNK